MFYFSNLYFFRPDTPDSLVSVSCQVVKLHLSCIKGLHHHVPILFDYFHFGVIDTTIHAVLVKLSLPDPRYTNSLICLNNLICYWYHDTCCLSQTMLARSQVYIKIIVSNIFLFYFILLIEGLEIWSKLPKIVKSIQSNGETYQGLT